MIMKRISQLFKNVFLSIVISTSLLFVSSCSNKKEDINIEVNPDLDVTIGVVFDKHVHTSSNNPQKVKKGEPAVFKLEFDDKFVFESTSDGIFDVETSTLTLDSSNGNMTAKVNSLNTSGFTLSIDEDSALGYFRVTPEKEFYLPEDEITVEYTSREKEFLCWTYDSPYRNGEFGITGVPVSFDQKATISIDKDTRLYVNFFEEDDDALIIDYDLNGGHTKDNQAIIHTDSVIYDPNNKYFSRNSINLSSYAFKEGYLLDSLNTKADGSGKRIGVGSRIDTHLFTNKKITLYAQWVECSPSNLFTIHELDEETAEIVGCTSYAGDTLVIPSLINKHEIVGIKENAFSNVSNVKTLYLPDTIVYVRDNAFLNMSSLTDLHLFTSVETISKRSFDAPNLRYLYLNKNTYPIDPDVAWDNLSCYKEGLLQKDQNKANVIAVGYSTMRANHDLSPLEDAYGSRYNFYIYGASIGIDNYLLLTSILDILRSQDYLILPMWPPLEQRYDSHRNISLLQYELDCLLNADYQCIKDFIWDSFTAYRELCTKELGVNAYQVESHNYRDFNSTGGNYEGTETDDPTNGTSDQYYNFMKDVNPNNYSYLTNVFYMVPFPKNHILMTWNPYNQNCIDSYADYSAYERMIRNKFNYCSFFDSQLDNIYPGNYFQVNDFSHLSRFGASKRIERWVTQLNPYFGH